jgi:hypothetical protein
MRSFASSTVLPQKLMPIKNSGDLFKSAMLSGIITAAITTITRKAVVETNNTRFKPPHSLQLSARTIEKLTKHRSLLATNEGNNPFHATLLYQQRTLQTSL